jgi:hypothetical protein
MVLSLHIETHKLDLGVNSLLTSYFNVQSMVLLWYQHGLQLDMEC